MASAQARGPHAPRIYSRMERSCNGMHDASKSTHSLRALIISSPARYERAARVAIQAGFSPELVPGHFGHASRCLPEKYINNASRPIMLPHILHRNIILNMIESGRAAARIIVKRNISHAVFEDDIVLGTSREAVQCYLAERAGSHSMINLGGCLLECKHGPSREKRCELGATFTCGHASYMDPKMAQEVLRRTEPCEDVTKALDGNFARWFCAPDAARAGLRPCADWTPLLHFYQGAGWMPSAVDARCSHCPRHASASLVRHPRSQIPWFDGESLEARCRTCASLENRSRSAWFPDPYGWVGFGHFLQDRAKIDPHLHDSQNRLKKTSHTIGMVKASEGSVGNRSRWMAAA